MQDLGEEEGKGLSPGLSYLEQVCQMLEEVARQQMHNQALQMDANASREHQDMEESQVKTFTYTSLKGNYQGVTDSTSGWPAL